MAHVLRTFELANGESVAVETRATPYEAERIAATDSNFVERSGKKFADALKTAEQVASEAISVFSSIDGPDEMEVSFSVKIGADVGIILTSVESEAIFQINVKWKKSP